MAKIHSGIYKRSIIKKDEVVSPKTFIDLRPNESIEIEAGASIWGYKISVDHVVVNRSGNTLPLTFNEELNMCSIPLSGGEEFNHDSSAYWH